MRRKIARTVEQVAQDVDLILGGSQNILIQPPGGIAQRRGVKAELIDSASDINRLGSKACEVLA